MGNRLTVAVDEDPKNITDFITTIKNVKEKDVKHKRKTIEDTGREITSYHHAKMGFNCTCSIQLDAKRSSNLDCYVAIWNVKSDQHEQVKVFPYRLDPHSKHHLEAAHCYILLFVFGVCRRCSPPPGNVRQQIDIHSNTLLGNVLLEARLKIAPTESPAYIGLLNSPARQKVLPETHQATPLPSTFPLTYEIYVWQGNEASARNQGMALAMAANLNGSFSSNPWIFQSSESFSTAISGKPCLDASDFLLISERQEFQSQTSLHHRLVMADPSPSIVIQHLLLSGQPELADSQSHVIDDGRIAATQALERCHSPQLSMLQTSALEPLVPCRVLPTAIQSTYSSQASSIIISPRTVSAKSRVVAALAISPRGVMSRTTGWQDSNYQNQNSDSFHSVKLKSSMPTVPTQKTTQRHMPSSDSSSLTIPQSIPRLAVGSLLQENHQLSNNNNHHNQHPRNAADDTSSPSKRFRRSNQENTISLTTSIRENETSHDQSSSDSSNSRSSHSGRESQIINHPKYSSCGDGHVSGSLIDSFETSGCRPRTSHKTLMIRSSSPVPISPSSAASSNNNQQVNISDLTVHPSRPPGIVPGLRLNVLPSLTNNNVGTTLRRSYNPPEPFRDLCSYTSSPSSSARDSSQLQSATNSVIKSDADQPFHLARQIPVANCSGGAASRRLPPLPSQEPTSQGGHQNVPGISRLKLSSLQQQQKLESVPFSTSSCSSIPPSSRTISSRRSDPLEGSKGIESRSVTCPLVTHYGSDLLLSKEGRTLSSTVLVEDFCARITAESGQEEHTHGHGGDNDVNNEEPISKEALLGRYRNICTEVVPSAGFYISGAGVSQNYDQLKEIGITHIINVAGDTCCNHFPDHFRYLTFILQDNRYASEEIQAILYNALEYVERILEVNQTNKVLIHCREGVSRSATLVVAYLMWKGRISFSEALNILRQRRPMCNPNTGFTFILLRFQKALLLQWQLAENKGRSNMDEIAEPLPQPQTSLPDSPLSPRKQSLSNNFSRFGFTSKNQTKQACNPGKSDFLDSPTDRVMERKLLRLCAHHEKAPFIVALGVSFYEPTQGLWMPSLQRGLDPRFFYILRNNHEVYFWRGSQSVHCQLSESFFTSEYMRHLRLFEGIRDWRIFFVEEGAESDTFWKYLYPNDQQIKKNISTQSDLDFSCSVLQTREVFNFAEYCQRQHSNTYSYFNSTSPSSPTVTSGSSFVVDGSILCNSGENTSKRGSYCLIETSRSATASRYRQSRATFDSRGSLIPLSSDRGIPISQYEGEQRRPSILRRRFTVAAQQRKTFGSASSTSSHKTYEDRTESLMSRTNTFGEMSSSESIAVNSTDQDIPNPWKTISSFPQQKEDVANSQDVTPSHTFSKMSQAHFRNVSSSIEQNDVPFIDQGKRSAVGFMLPSEAQRKRVDNLEMHEIFACEQDQPSVTPAVKAKFIIKPIPLSLNTQVIPSDEPFSSEVTKKSKNEVRSPLPSLSPHSRKLVLCNVQLPVRVMSKLDSPSLNQIKDQESPTSTEQEFTASDRNTSERLVTALSSNIIKTGIQSVKVREGNVDLELDVPYLYEWPHFVPIDVFDDEDLSSNGFYIIVQYGPKPLLDMLGRLQYPIVNQQPLSRYISRCSSRKTSSKIEDDECQRGNNEMITPREPSNVDESFEKNQGLSERGHSIIFREAVHDGDSGGTVTSTSSSLRPLLTLLPIGDLSESPDGLTRAIEIPGVNGGSLSFRPTTMRTISSLTGCDSQISETQRSASNVLQTSQFDHTLSKPDDELKPVTELASSVDQVEIEAAVTSTILWVWRGSEWRLQNEPPLSDEEIVEQFKTSHGILPEDFDVVVHWEVEGEESDEFQKVLWLS